MIIDGQKTASKRKALPVQETSQTDETETDEEEEEKEDRDFIDDDEASDTASASGTDAETDLEEDTSNAKSPLKAVKNLRGKKEVKKAAPSSAKRKRPVRTQKGGRKKAKIEKAVEEEEEEEGKEANDDEKVEDDDEKTETKHGKKEKEENDKKKKKEAPLFSDKNVDFDLFNSAAANVIPRRIKLSSNIIVTCRMIDQLDGALNYDYAALTIQRKCKGDKMFEFVLPLTLVPRLIEASKIIIKENPKFFAASTVQAV